MKLWFLWMYLNSRWDLENYGFLPGTDLEGETADQLSHHQNQGDPSLGFASMNFGAFFGGFGFSGILEAGRLASCPIIKTREIPIWDMLVWILGIFGGVGFSGILEAGRPASRPDSWPAAQLWCLGQFQVWVCFIIYSEYFETIIYW